jgi:hypothetical protein
LGRAFFGDYATHLLDACNALLQSLCEKQAALGTIGAHALESLRGTLLGPPLTLLVCGFWFWFLVLVFGFWFLVLVFGFGFGFGFWFLVFF